MSGEMICTRDFEPCCLAYAQIDDRMEPVSKPTEPPSDQQLPENPIAALLADEQPTKPPSGNFRKAGQRKPPPTCPECGKEFVKKKYNQLTCGDKRCKDKSYVRRNRAKVRAHERRKRRIAREESKFQERQRLQTERDVEYESAERAKPGDSSTLGGSDIGKDIRESIRNRYGDGGERLIERLAHFAFGLDADVHPKLQLEALKELLDRGWGRPQQQVTQTNPQPIFFIPQTVNQMGAAPALMLPDMGNPPIETTVVEFGSPAQDEPSTEESERE